LRVVIIVHHCGYNDSRMRGHSSLPGAVDASLAITREGDVATMAVEYMRDGAEGTEVRQETKRSRYSVLLRAFLQAI
jgi:hypothetical protein